MVGEQDKGCAGAGCDPGEIFEWEQEGVGGTSDFYASSFLPALFF